MQRDRAEKIVAITGDFRFKALLDEVQERKELAEKKLRNPINTHEKDMLYKGGILMAEDILGLTEEAHRVLEPQKEEDVS